ncbi:MAG TPA: NADPH-dependent FMN reductase [Thermoanaerobaculia bacterium]|nr:NADPH-dependent FMN reductase [Thermoanaerobaculia bacterium]
MKIVAICGSLRAASSNLALLRAAAAVAPAGMELAIYEGLGGLPHFNPDLNGDDPPATVRELRDVLIAADGVVISSPEYAHGIPGALKNALDWLVSTGELAGKPVVLINAATSGGERGQAAIIQTLSAMQWKVLTDASLLAPFVHKKIDAHGNVTDPAILAALRSSLGALAKAIGG